MSIIFQINYFEYNICVLGVGVQAVVTEYLIRYCELIFSDKMPSYTNGGGSTQNGIGRVKNVSL